MKSTTTQGAATMHRTNLAGRAGAWSADNWKKSFFGWIALVAVLIVGGTALGTKTLTEAETGSGEAAQAQQLLADAGFDKTPVTESVLIQSAKKTVDDAGFRAAVAETVRTLGSVENVENIRSPFKDATTQGQIAPSRRAVLVNFDVSGEPDAAPDKVAPILVAVDTLASHHPSLTIEQFGSASAAHELDETVGKDFAKAEKLSVPITLVIMFFAFGALVAAGLPVLLAFSGVLASIGAYAIVSHVVPASDATTSVILLIGMAVGVDYSLFYLRREREERRAGADPHTALLRTAATSGQAVLISGATVMIAMAGMVLSGNKLFTSLGVGSMVVVLLAMIGSLSVLPALLSKLGDKVDRGRLPWLGKRLAKQQGAESRFWGAVLRPVLARPLAALLVAGGALVALTLPVLGMHTKLPSFVDLPAKLQIVQSYKDVQAAFPGAQTPAVVVLRSANVTYYDETQAIADLKDAALHSGGLMSEPVEVEVNPAHTVATISIPVAGTGDDALSNRALAKLREDILPATLGQVDGAKYAVTGQTAGTKDFNDQMKSRIPIVFAFVLGLAFLLLLLTFRSIVIPAKAILMNLLSIGASYGILVLVFQHTWAQSLLGFKSNGAIASWLPLFLFVVLFGLSMDYHVFIISRIKELVDGGMKTADAVEHGIKSTASTVTSAALVMVAVFAIFATLSAIDIKQMGFGLAVAVLLDATIVRAVLLPATMKLLGEWNWYLPRWLEWLPSLSAEGPVREQAPEAPPVPAL
jgi:RND superfamily putative drug exporter